MIATNPEKIKEIMNNARKNFPSIKCVKFSTTNHKEEKKRKPEYLIEDVRELDLLSRLVILTGTKEIIGESIGYDMWEKVNSKDAWQNHFQPHFNKVIEIAKIDKTALLQENDLLNRILYLYDTIIQISSSRGKELDSEWQLSLKKCLDELRDMLKKAVRGNKEEEPTIDIVTGYPRSWVDSPRPRALEKHIKEYIEAHESEKRKFWYDKSYEVLWLSKTTLKNLGHTAERNDKCGLVLFYHEEIPEENRGDWEMVLESKEAAMIGQETMREAERKMKEKPAIMMNENGEYSLDLSLDI